jgi:two-component system, NarL family, sensor histidine kinase UhpB
LPFHKNTVRREATQQKKISQAMIRAQEQERDRTGREHHDNVNQLIATAKLHVGIGRRAQGNTKKALEKTEEYLVEALGAIRLLTYRLTPAW